jgi:nitrite reductase/ring-hydroxylating ferredoxin subunit
MKEFDDSKASKGMGSAANIPAGLKTTWIPVQGLTDGIPNLEEGKVVLIDTMAKALQNGATNPTGAVAVVKYGPSVFCTSVGCASCQIPLNKADLLEPNDETDNKDPRIACSFCRATYNLKTGARVAPVDGGGLVGGLVKGLFSKQDQKSLPVYALGEKNGQVLINLGGALGKN